MSRTIEEILADKAALEAEGATVALPAAATLMNSAELATILSQAQALHSLLPAEAKVELGYFITVASNVPMKLAALAQAAAPPSPPPPPPPPPPPAE